MTAEQPPDPQVPQQVVYVPVRNSGMAVASMVLGLVGVIFFVLFAIPSILAVIFGFVARGEIRRSAGRLTGDGMAITGIILGSVEILVFVIAVASGNFHFQVGGRPF